MTRARAIAEAVGDSRGESYAAGLTGWVYVLQGEYEQGIETCRRAVEISRAPVTSAITLGFLGAAYHESGDAAGAISRRR
mgnify:FL=1